MTTDVRDGRFRGSRPQPVPVPALQPVGNRSPGFASKPRRVGERRVSPRRRVCGATRGPLARKMNRDRLGNRVCQPVLRHAVPRVGRALVSPVPVGGGRRQDLDHHLRRALHVVAAASRMFPLPGEERQVRLPDLRIGKHHVAGRGQHLAQAGFLDEAVQQPRQRQQDPPMFQVRRRSHVQVPVQQFMAPILRRRPVVVVCELRDVFRASSGAAGSAASRSRESRGTSGRVR